MLTQMVKAIAHTRSLQWLRDAVARLDQEYDWWDRQHLVPTTNLSRYLPYDAAALPRPESYREDEAVVSDMTPALRNFTLGALIGGAESGWDFSSRWIRANGVDLRNISTQSVLPVCLNSILYSNERILADLHSQLSLHASSQPTSPSPLSSSSSSFSLRSCLNHTLKSNSYTQRSQQRAAAMRALMWSATQSRWHDSCTTPPCPLPATLYASSVMPLWAGLGLGPGL
jgi:neutral trehalase